MKPMAYFDPIIASLKQLKQQFAYFEIVGDYRRCTPTMEDIHVACVVENNKQEAVLYAWTTRYKNGIGKYDFSYSNFLQGKVECVANIVFHVYDSLDEWPSALLYHTGSRKFVEGIQNRATDFGFEFNDLGLWSAGLDDYRIIAPSEAEIFSCLDMAYVPPEQRC